MSFCTPEHPQEPPHLCPFDEELDSPVKPECTCCAACQQLCVMET